MTYCKAHEVQIKSLASEIKDQKAENIRIYNKIDKGVEKVEEVKDRLAESLLNFRKDLNQLAVKVAGGFAVLQIIAVVILKFKS